MATITVFQASFDDDNVTMHITADDVSLQVQGLVYHNATSQGAALVLSGPKKHTYKFPPNNDQTLDLTSQNIVLVARSVVDKYGRAYTAYDLPGGEQVSFQWPA